MGYHGILWYVNGKFLLDAKKQWIFNVLALSLKNENYDIENKHYF